LIGPTCILPQLNTGSFVLHGRATAIRRAFYDQVDCFRVRRDPGTIAKVTRRNTSQVSRYSGSPHH
jgi:hypothetical protein